MYNGVYKKFDIIWDVLGISKELISFYNLILDLHFNSKFLTHNLPLKIKQLTNIINYIKQKSLSLSIYIYIYIYNGVFTKSDIILDVLGISKELILFIT